MGKEIVCRICKTKQSPHFANLFDTQVRVYESKNFMISYFEAMQQLTGIEVCIQRCYAITIPKQHNSNTNILGFCT